MLEARSGLPVSGWTGMSGYEVDGGVLLGVFIAFGLLAWMAARDEDPAPCPAVVVVEVDPSDR